MNHQKNMKLKRNIKLEYIFSFLSKFSLTGAVWVLYLSFKGMSLAQIGILEGIFHVTGLLSEVPSGALADRMGRKKVMLLSCIANILSSSIILCSFKLWQFAIGFVFSAWSYNLLSGTEEAMLYDSCLGIGEEEHYYKVNSHINVIIEISQGVSTCIGGVLAELSFSYCYLGAILVQFFSFIPCLLMVEPNSKREEEEGKATWKEHFIISYHVIKENTAVAKILFFFALVFTFDTSVYFYCQKYFEEAGLSKIEISLVLLVSGVISCLGALFSEAIVKRVGERMKYIAGSIIGVGILSLSFGNIVLSIVCFVTESFFNAMLYPLQSASLNKLIPSEQRATIISVGSMTFSCFMIVLFPVMGWIGDRFGLEKAFLVTGICAILICAGLGLNQKKWRKEICKK